MKTFYFTAGEQVVTSVSHNVLDAWMKISMRHKHTHPIACEFRELPISAHDIDGNVLSTRTWEEWDNEVLRDTYGDDYRAILDSAASKL